MYHLATVHSVTGRQMDRWQYDASSQTYCMQQYNQLKPILWNKCQQFAYGVGVYCIWVR